MSLPARSLAAVLLLAANAAAQRPFTTGDLWAWRGLLDPRISPDGALVAYIERRADRASNSYRSALRIVRTDGSNSVPPRDGPGDDWHPRWSPDASRIAYLSDRTGHTQIYVRPPGNAAEVAIATENVPLNLAWSGDSKTLAYTAISKEPLPGNTWAPLELRPRLQRQHTRLVVVPANGGESKPVILGSREPAGEPVWLADGRGIVLALTEPFDPDHPLEGAEIYLLQSPAWTPKRLSNHPGPDTDPIASPDGSRIAWLSREPVQQSYVTPKLWAANSDGSRARALAGALDRDPVHPAWSSDSRTVYFVADDRGESRIYGARNDGSVRTVLSAPWLSGFSLADNGKAVAVRAPGELIVFPVDVVGEPVVLAAPNRELIAARTPAAVEKLEYRSGARTIDAWLTLPPGFDPAKRYPLLAGMGDSPARMCSPGFSLRSQVLAASGMIVLCANARGTPGYGESFANLIRTGIPGDAFQDWLAGIEAVAAKPYIDASRISVAGGLVAAWAIGHTDRFHAAVLRRPVADFTLDVATRADGAQRAAAWLGAMPWADPDQYWKNSPLYAAAAFRTPTLIIAADHDPAADELAFALRMRRVESALVRIGDERPGDLALEWDALLAWVNR